MDTRRSLLVRELDVNRSRSFRVFRVFRGSPFGCPSGAERPRQVLWFSPSSVQNHVTKRNRQEDYGQEDCGEHSAGTRNDFKIFLSVIFLSVCLSVSFLWRWRARQFVPFVGQSSFPKTAHELTQIRTNEQRCRNRVRRAWPATVGAASIVSLNQSFQPRIEHGSNTDFQNQPVVRVSSVFHPWLPSYLDLHSSRRTKNRAVRSTKEGRTKSRA